jgi:hypothetical protein
LARLISFVILWLLAPVQLTDVHTQSAAIFGCDPSLWQHVYNPNRLVVKQQCIGATGIIVDATKGKNKDGARHEADGDGHNWLKLDPGQEALLLPGNVATQQGNLVFEIICRYRVTQADAKTACQNFKSAVVLPPIGTHVRVWGSLIEDMDHKPIHREIHPVTRIDVLVGN